MIFNPEQERNKQYAKREEELVAMNNVDVDINVNTEGELQRVGEKFSSNISLSRTDLFKNGVAMGNT